VNGAGGASGQAACRSHKLEKWCHHQESREIGQARRFRPNGCTEDATCDCACDIGPDECK